MGRKRRSNDDGCYVSNKELRELVIRYNDINPNDHGEWIPKYEKTMKTKGKLDEVKDWLEMRKFKYAIRGYDVTPEFARISSKLFNAVYKIAKGRVACFPGIPVDEREDVTQDCVIAVLQYINRYREDVESSAFSYLTQIVNNALKLHMGQHNESMWCRCPMSEVAPENNRLYYGDNGASEVEFEYEV